ncbi:MAG: phage tail protein [Enterococcus sp.]
MTVFIDVQKKEHIALTDISFSHKVNGEKSLRGTIYTGDEVINNIDRGWSLTFEDEVYFITYALPVDNGEVVTVEFDAVHEFFFKMGKSVVYKQLTGSNTALSYLNLIFTGSGYNFSLGTTIPAFEKQNFGMKNRLALFNDFINSTNTEFKIVDKTVTIVEKVGNDLSTIVRKGFNMQDLSLEQNIGEFVTYVKGFGAFKDPDDESKGRLEVEYRSPLADIYGVLEADPVVDERYTQTDSMLARLKELVESSYSISVSLTVEDLQQAGYKYAFPNPGDYIMAIDEKLGFQQKIRIVGIEESFDIMGNPLNKSVACSSLSLADQKNEADANNSQNWSDIANGVKPIPNEWLTDAIQTATSALLDAQTELKFTNNGIIAIEKGDSNRLVILNSAGVGVSTNGGKTFENAITASGINASAITTGILKAINIVGAAISGSTLEGNNIFMDLKNGDFQTTQAANGGITTAKYSNGEITFSDNRAPTGEKYKANITAWGVMKGETGKAYPALQLRAYNFARLYITESPTELRIRNNSNSTGFIDLIAQETYVSGNFNVQGTKNAIHATRDGIRETPAYETTESYLGDIGIAETDDHCTTTILIDELFSDVVNTDYEYQVFLQSYSDGYVYVEERAKDSFVVRSSAPHIPFAWEIKAKRRGYEKERLTLNRISFEEFKELCEKEVFDEQQNLEP